MRFVAVCLCLCFLYGLKCYGQVCPGSLGDPIFQETFKAGPNPGKALDTSKTTYKYDYNGCPDDGSYSIVNSISPYCHDTWHALPHDHTGDPNGYMMLVNASYGKGVFYIQQAPVLCNNTIYEFSAYIMNLVTPQAEADNPILPNITFIAQTVDGEVLDSVRTGDIPTTSDPNGWVKYALTFHTRGSGDVIVKMVNNAFGGKGNDLVLDDITFRACGPTINAQFKNGSLTTTQDQPICFGNAASIHLSATLGPGSGNYTFQWQQSLNGGSWSDIPNKIGPSYDVPFVSGTAVGTYQYRVAATSPDNISSLTCRTYSDPLAVRVIDNPVASVSSVPPVCEGSAFTLTASGGTTYQWTGPDNVLLPDHTASITINNAGRSNAGTYQVVAINQYNCSSPAPATTTVIVIPKMITTISADTAVCPGSSVTLSATGGTHYRWSPSAGLSDPASANPTATPQQTTTYQVSIDNGICFETKSVTITVLDPPVANAGPDKILFEGQSVMLSGSVTGGGPLTYSWTPATDLDDPNSLTPNATPKDDITYVLHVVSDKGCGMSTDTVFVKVYKRIVIPTAFSPNSDGINDTWNIEALITYPQCDLQVFNRYGDVVFKSRGYAKPWNGAFNGKLLPTGTYYYVLDLKNGKPKMSGSVAIVR